MRILNGLSAFVFFFSFVSFAIAQENVGITAPPEWAKILRVEEFTSDREDQFVEGIAMLLSDRQIRKTPNGYEYFIRSAYKVVSRSGLEYAAKVDPTFDPSDSTLNYNFVRLIRDYDEIDKLTDAEIIELRQEEELNSNLIDGDITALIQLKDIRVGDIIDVAYSGEVVTELWPDDYFDDVWVEWTVPIAKYHYSFTVPVSVDVQVSSIVTGVHPAITYRNGWKTYEFTVLDAEPVTLESNIPSDWIPFGFVSFTTMESWSDVIDWAIPVFSFEDELPADYRARLDRIAAEHPSPEARAVEALRLVQSDIRYLGLLDGLGSHKPRAPSVTIERGYGDCKDKSVLLVAALNYLGVSATPVLANVYMGNILDQRPPSINAFNHVIVAVDFGGRLHWMDPTYSHQGGDLSSLSELDYGFVLPISTARRDLVKMSVKPPRLPYIDVTETYEIPEDGDVGMILKVDYLYRSHLADGRRAEIEELGREQWSRGILDYYSAIYQGLEQIGVTEIEDDFENNVMRFSASYQKDRKSYLASKFDTELPVYAAVVDDIIPRSVEANRFSPLGLSYPNKRRHLIRLVTPGRRLPSTDNERESAPGVTYQRNFYSKGDTLEIEYLLTVSKRRVEGDDIKAVTKLASKISSDADIVLDISQAVSGVDVDVAGGLGITLDPEMEAAINVMAQTYSAGNHREVLSQLNDLLDQHPQQDEVHGFLQMIKGSVLMDLRRYRSARIAYSIAFSLYEPSASDEYYNYITLLESARKYSEAATMIVRLLEHHPNSLVDFDEEWLSDFFSDLRVKELTEDREKTILAIAHAANNAPPENLSSFKWMLAEAFEIHARRNEADAAEPFLPYVSNPRSIVRMLANRQMQVVWPSLEDKAGLDVSKAIQENVELKRDALDEAPEDFEKLTAYVSALRAAEQLDEVFELGENVIRDWDTIEDGGENAYWFVNEYAYALYESGETDEALDLMTRLIDIGLERHRDLISMAINRAQMLMHSELYEEAIVAIEEIEAMRRNPASEYGWMWIYDAKACSLHQLGRDQEADAVFNDEILPIAKANPSAQTKTLLCLGKIDAAAELMIARLGNEKEQDTAIWSFTEVDKPEHAPPFLEQLQQRAAQMKSRPDVEQAFDDVARKINVKGASTYWGNF